MIIDAHQHFWDRTAVGFDHRWQESPGLEKICRSFMPADLLPHLETTGVERTIFVQTQHNVAENRWALSLADKYDFICGVVGWVDLQSSDCQRQLLEFIDHPKFVGIRHVTQDEPDDDFIVSEEVARGLAILEKHGVPFDLLFFPRHLRHAATVARRFPNLKLVIDHLSKPSIKSGEMTAWRRDLAAAAACPNVSCKLSGMVTEADWSKWTVADLRPYAETVIELFTPRRLMFGSDWPVCELAASYAQVVDTTRQLIGDLSTDERQQIMGSSAQQFYNLKI